MRPPQVSETLIISGLKRGPFILWRGVIGWGVPCGVLFALLLSMKNLAEHLPVMLPVSLTVFPLMGIVFGQLLWQAMARLEHLAEESAGPL